jgi:hypothetical protein
VTGACFLGLELSLSRVPIVPAREVAMAFRYRLDAAMLRHVEV